MNANKLFLFPLSLLTAAALFMTPAFAEVGGTADTDPVASAGAVIAPGSEEPATEETQKEPEEEVVIIEMEEAPLSQTISDTSGYKAYEIKRLMNADRGLSREQKDMAASVLDQVNAYSFDYESYVDSPENQFDVALINECARISGVLDRHIFPGSETSDELLQYFNDHVEEGWYTIYDAEDCTQFGGRTYKAASGDVAVLQGRDGKSYLGVVAWTNNENELCIVFSPDEDTVVMQTVGRASRDVNLSKIVHITYPSAEVRILWFLQDELGLNTAAACGILANMRSESNFYIYALGDEGTSYGLCQWHAGRWDNMKNFCATNGLSPDTLEGQLNYLKHELENSYSWIYESLKSVPNSANGAYEAGYLFCLRFERPAGGEISANNRGNAAKNEFWPKYVR